eukprot:5801493-Pyramimonas_sp.AAC.1
MNDGTPTPLGRAARRQQRGMRKGDIMIGRTPAPASSPIIAQPSLGTDKYFNNTCTDVATMFPGVPPGLQLLSKIKEVFLVRQGVRVD